MRGDDEISGSLFSYIDLETRVRADHLLQVIRPIANTALASLSRDFAALYSGLGRPPVPPEKLLRAMLLEAFYSVRSERQLMERIEFDLLFRWFVATGVDDPVWDHSNFSKNRDRLPGGDRGEVSRRGAVTAADQAVAVERAFLGQACPGAGVSSRKIGATASDCGKLSCGCGSNRRQTKRSSSR